MPKMRPMLTARKQWLRLRRALQFTKSQRLPSKTFPIRHMCSLLAPTASGCCIGRAAQAVDTHKFTCRKHSLGPEVGVEASGNQEVLLIESFHRRVQQIVTHIIAWYCLHARGGGVLGGRGQCEHPLSQTSRRPLLGQSLQGWIIIVSSIRYLQPSTASTRSSWREGVPTCAQRLGHRRCTFKVNPPNLCASFKRAASCKKMCCQACRAARPSEQRKLSTENVSFPLDASVTLTA